jgi:hypothetical protein
VGFALTGTTLLDGVMLAFDFLPDSIATSEARLGNILSCCTLQYHDPDRDH